MKRISTRNNPSGEILSDGLKTPKRPKKNAAAAAAVAPAPATNTNTNPSVPSPATINPAPPQSSALSSTKSNTPRAALSPAAKSSAPSQSSPSAAANAAPEAPITASASPQPPSSPKRSVEDVDEEQKEPSPKRQRTESPEIPAPAANQSKNAKSKLAKPLIPTDPAGKEAYLVKNFGRGPRKFLNPTTKEIIWTDPEDDSDEEARNPPPHTKESHLNTKRWISGRKRAQIKLKEGEEEMKLCRKGFILAEPEPLIAKKTTSREHSESAASRQSERLFQPDHLIFPPIGLNQFPFVLADVHTIEVLREIALYTQHKLITLPSAEVVIKAIEDAMTTATTAQTQVPPTSDDQEPSAPMVEVTASPAATSTSPPQISENQHQTASGSPAGPNSEEDVDMSDIESEVDANQAAPTTPVQPQPQPDPQPQGWLSTVKKAITTPFTFFGRNRNQKTVRPSTTNGNETEFTFTQPHQFAHPPSTPTPKSRRAPQSERRAQHNSNRVNQSNRPPQTERHMYVNPRQVSQSTPSAQTKRRSRPEKPPLAKRGDLSPERWAEKNRELAMYEAEQERAALRRDNREANAASSEESELSHAKSKPLSFKPTFQVPEDSDSDSEDDDTDDETQDQPKRIMKPERGRPDETHPPSWRQPGDPDWKYEISSDYPRSLNLYRRIDPVDLSYVCFDRFGEETVCKIMMSGVDEHHPRYRKIETETDFLKGDEWYRVAYHNKTLKNQANEKRMAEKKWAKITEEIGEEAAKERRVLLGTEGLSEIELEEGEVYCWYCEKIRPLHPRDLPYDKNTAFRNCYRCFYLLKDAHNDPDTLGAGASAVAGKESLPAEPIPKKGSALQQKQCDQTTPPPKPRPSNAQLPQPSAAEAAKAAANKYQPKKPSGLRHMATMSPEVDKENREKELDNPETQSKMDEVDAFIKTFRGKDEQFSFADPIEDYDLPPGIDKETMHNAIVQAYERNEAEKRANA